MSLNTEEAAAWEDPKVVLITGASSGIGAATARRLARDGLRVALLARRVDRLAQVAAEIDAAGGRVLAAPADVRDRQAIAGAVEATLEEWGRIDVLVNNAGLGYPSRVVDFDPDRLREVVETNLLGLVECTQAVLPAMLRQKSGHIINIASLAGFIGLPGSSIYSATKAAVILFSDGLRRELRRDDIRVTALCPGFVATESSPRLHADGEPRRPARRLPGVMPAGYVADRIAGLIRRPRRCLIIPPGWGFLVWAGRTLPWLADWAFARFAGDERV